MRIKPDQIRLGLTNPKLLARKFSQIYNQLQTKKRYNTKGISHIGQDWDNLIILDACRYDLFEELNDIPGNLRSVESRGSATSEFLRGNFRDRELLDTVYVTTNPMLYRHRDEIRVTFHDVVNLWTGETWSEDHQTVLPEVVTTEAKQATDEYPNKRLIIHYMQPHYPFIEAETTFDKGHIGKGQPDELTTWMKVTTGKVNIDKGQLWDAYADNLQRALPHVAELIESLRGKTVVTSDHGNMFGERASPIPVREWGHPAGIWTDELVEVPWLEVPYNERKEITHGSSGTTDVETDGQVHERLQSLGYK